jgi:hypothetical protein
MHSCSAIAACASFQRLLAILFCQCRMCFMATGVIVSTLAGTPQALGVVPVAAPLSWPTPAQLQAAGALMAAAAASQLALVQLAKQVGA